MVTPRIQSFSIQCKVPSPNAKTQTAEEARGKSQIPSGLHTVDSCSMRLIATITTPGNASMISTTLMVYKKDSCRNMGWHSMDQREVIVG
jgi:hypothetical protein